MSDIRNKVIEEIKKVYRKKRNQFHPDKLISKGLPEELLEKTKTTKVFRGPPILVDRKNPNCWRQTQKISGRTSF